MQCYFDIITCPDSRSSSVPGSRFAVEPKANVLNFFSQQEELGCCPNPGKWCLQKPGLYEKENKTLLLMMRTSLIEYGRCFKIILGKNLILNL